MPIQVRPEELGEVAWWPPSTGTIHVSQEMEVPRKLTAYTDPRAIGVNTPVFRAGRSSAVLTRRLGAA